MTFAHPGEVLLVGGERVRVAGPVSERLRVVLMLLVAIAQMVDLLTFAAAVSVAPLEAETAGWARIVYAAFGLPAVILVKALFLIPMLFIVDQVVRNADVRLPWKVFVPTLVVEWGLAGAATNLAAIAVMIR